MVRARGGGDIVAPGIRLARLLEFARLAGQGPGFGLPFQRTPVADRCNPRKDSTMIPVVARRSRRDRSVVVSAADARVFRNARRSLRLAAWLATLTASLATSGAAGTGPLPRQFAAGRHRPADGVVLVGDEVGDPVVLVGDEVGDPGFSPGSAADSPTESSGAFDGVRGDLGTDEDLAGRERGPRRPRRLPSATPLPAPPPPDPLAGTPRIDPATTGVDAERIVATLLPPRSDAPRDWVAPLEPLHACGEPRALPPCVPPAPCHPARPPAPLDLVGVAGMPSCGPIYRGPCEPRSGTRHEGPWRWLASAHDRLVDFFYTSR
jgi:hypothetical protein